MMAFLASTGFYLLAAFFEIAGCFSFWAWLRLNRTAWWAVPGLLSLSLFAICLTQVESSYAGRTFAAYGGVYIGASLLWLLVVEGVAPDRWDMVGAIICLFGAAIILYGPR
jgi:small multidrug resistance family-3 protein